MTPRSRKGVAGCAWPRACRAGSGGGRRLDSAVVSEEAPLAAQATTDVPNRPCAHCGRPVPQRAAAGRPFRYCRDNDDACLRAARAARMRQRNAPGLAGQVAQAFEVVERLDRVAETLTEALHAELSPDGVERQVTAVRADTAARIAAAHGERDAAQAERDEARRDADRARTDATTARDESERVRGESARTVEAALAQAESARKRERRMASLYE